MGWRYFDAFFPHALVGFEPVTLGLGAQEPILRMIIAQPSLSTGACPHVHCRRQVPGCQLNQWVQIGMERSTSTSGPNMTSEGLYRERVNMHPQPSTSLCYQEYIK